MSLINAVTSINNAIIANMSDYTADNCKVGDEAVFAYIQNTEGAPQTCCITEYAGFGVRGASEFASRTIEWRIVINVFFRIQNTDYNTPLQSARTFVDDLIQLVSSNPTLDGTVMVARPRTGSEPMSYARGNYEYVFVVVEFDVMDNIS